MPELRSAFSGMGDKEDLEALVAHVTELEERQRTLNDIGIKFAVFLKVATDVVINKAAVDLVNSLVKEDGAEGGTEG